MPSKSEKSKWKAKKWFPKALESDNRMLRAIIFWGLPICELDKFFCDDDFEPLPDPRENGYSFTVDSTQESVEAVIRAAFELGFIEQAMDCQRRLERYAQQE